jgi:hypothetical protein
MNDHLFEEKEACNKQESGNCSGGAKKYSQVVS